MNFGIHVSYHDTEKECRACERLNEVTVTYDHETNTYFWECPEEDCRYENERWVEDEY